MFSEHFIICTALHTVVRSYHLITSCIVPHRIVLCCTDLVCHVRCSFVLYCIVLNYYVLSYILDFCFHKQYQSLRKKRKEENGGTYNRKYQYVPKNISLHPSHTLMFKIIIIIMITLIVKLSFKHFNHYSFHIQNNFCA